MPYAYIEFVQPPGGGRWPTDPGFGIPEGGHPGQGLPGFPGAPGHPGHLPARPGRPTDPGYGVDEGGEAGQLPVWPLDPEHPDTGLPPVPGHPLPPIDPPPGTIWPPLPPSVPAGKALVLVFISGIGYRYAVVTIPEHETDPDYGVDEGAQPDQGLPPTGRPPIAGQPLPPTGAPPTAGQLPGRVPPARPQPQRR